MDRAKPFNTGPIARAGFALGVVILGCYFSSGVMKPMGRFFGSGGVMSARGESSTVAAMRAPCSEKA